jgi:hypothetical protein
LPKYLIADFIVEIEPKFDYLKKLSEPFLYEGERSADFSAIPSDSYLNSLLSRMVEGSTIDEAEEFATASIFNRKIIHRGIPRHLFLTEKRICFPPIQASAKPLIQRCG